VRDRSGQQDARHSIGLSQDTNPGLYLDCGIGVPLLTKLTLALTALALLVAPARAGCARTMCEWVAVEEWLAQQRADAEARTRMWQLFGPAPSPARIEEVRHWLDEQR
jgi:hypothetical protein